MHFNLFWELGLLLWEALYPVAVPAPCSFSLAAAEEPSPNTVPAARRWAGALCSLPALGIEIMLGEDPQALFSAQPGIPRGWDRLLCEDDVSPGDLCSTVRCLLCPVLMGANAGCRSKVQSLENSLNQLLSPENKNRPKNNLS